MIDGQAERQAGGFGGLEGAERNTRETIQWTPPMGSPDRIINPAKPMADARGEDMTRNDPATQGIVDTLRDTLVGDTFNLSANPSLAFLRKMSPAFDEKWLEDFQEAAEERFNLATNSRECYMDASRKLTFTAQVRLAVASFVMTGEVLATAEWIRQADRPFATAMQIISPSRLSNPNFRSDDQFLRRGIERDLWGAPKAYWIQVNHPGDAWISGYIQQWKRVDAQKPWGRRQVVHITDQMFPDQSRGVSMLTAALSPMRMLKSLQGISLQNAIVQATYAAAVESSLPTEVVRAMLGDKPHDDAAGVLNDFIGGWLTGLNTYLSGANNVAIDGVKIPHLYPGTTLNVKPAGTPGSVGTEFEVSLQRRIARAAGVTYEEFTGDYSKVNYSSIKAAISKIERTMKSRKGHVADGYANEVYALWMEEDFTNLPLPRGIDREFFYLPYAKQALTQAAWVNAGQGQIDELKETQAALARIGGNLSTLEREIGRMGGDWRAFLRQKAREKAFLKKLGLDEAVPAANGNTTQQRGNAADEEDEAA